jgi:putative pyruvate formate lyase activating enzyme
MRKGSYVYLTNEEWTQRIARFDAIIRSCTLCPRNCHVNRSAGERGYCDAPEGLFISSIFPHHGEEPPISGSGGSGTVFFSCCTLKCCFCQNWQISHEAEGRFFTPEELAGKMVSLQEKGCHNINLVTPTHFLPWVLRALQLAVKEGLTVPLVYNCGGYEHASTMALLGGIVDIYLPDMKYGSDRAAQLFSRTANYRSFNRTSLREMFRQVGPLVIDDDGIARRGLCVRHLVMPNGVAESRKVLDFLKTVFDPADIFISLMGQYRPLYHAGDFSEIDRPVTVQEYECVKEAFIKAGFRGFYQELDAIDGAFIIDFKTRKEEALTSSPAVPGNEGKAETATLAASASEEL